MHVHQPNPSVYQHIPFLECLGLREQGAGNKKESKQASKRLPKPFNAECGEANESTCLRRMETSFIAMGLGQNTCISRARPEVSLRLNNGQALCPQTVLVIPKKGPGSPLNAKSQETEPCRRSRVST